MNALVDKLESVAELWDGDKALVQEMMEPPFYAAPNRNLVVAGQRQTRVHVILEGIACRYKILRDGSRSIVAYLIPGDFCDLHVALLNEMDHSIATLTHCTVAEFSRESVECLLLNRRVACALWRTALVDDAILREWLVNVGRRPAERRLAHLLCELRLRFAAVHLANESEFKLPCSLMGLGDALGISALDVHRILAQLCANGLIGVEGRVVSVPNLKRLEEFAGFDARYLYIRRSPVRESAHDGEAAKVYLH